ncbi:NAD(P)-dependent oxidoreductase [bacterium]|nr:MAG: NAD(P)-dependent oxidoreductase [bacterium]
MIKKNWIVSTTEPILVTGSNGFIGSMVVKILLDYGFEHIRCFVRPSSNLASLRKVIGDQNASRTEIVEGNLLVPEDCNRALANVSVVFHLAAGIDKSFAGCFMNSVLTTRNLLEAVLVHRILKRFVNVSSFAVYSNYQMKRGSLLDETAPLETEHNKRQDPYGYGKLKQENLVLKYNREHKIPYTILRPGAVYGPGKSALTGRIGIDTFGVFLHLGGSNQLPLTYVDNCAEAIILAGLIEGAGGEVFNVVDDNLPSSRAFLKMFKKHTGGFFSLSLPYRLTFLLCSLWEKYAEWSEGQLPLRFNKRRCSSEWKGNIYSNDKLKKVLGWKPRISFDQASRQFFDSFQKKG